MNNDIFIPIKKLAAYALDYAKITTSTQSRGKKIETDQLNNTFFDTKDLLFKDQSEFSIELDIKSEFEEFMVRHNEDDFKALDEDRQKYLKSQHKIAKRNRKLLEKLNDIHKKIETDSYTKQVVLQSGRVDFMAKEIKTNKYGQVEEVAEEYTELSDFLFEIPIIITEKIVKNPTLIKFSFEIQDSEIIVRYAAMKKFILADNFNEIFNGISKMEAEDKNSLPLENFPQEAWNLFAEKLQASGALDVCKEPDFSTSIIALSAKSNYFLAEDLKEFIDMDEESLQESSLGAWSGVGEMNSEQEIRDDGESEIFFPFPYDKHQLGILGILNNKAAIVEGPPGTGKSQTISNLLVHLAAQGKKVLFASQKDQAVRGVKDKLKTLEIPFLFGYIPDRNSKLHSESDEIDSATSVLTQLGQRLEKEPSVKDQKSEISYLRKREQDFNNSISSNRDLFELLEEKRKLNWLEPYINDGFSRKKWSKHNQKLELISQKESEIEKKNREISSLYEKIEKNKLEITKLENEIIKFEDRTHESLSENFDKIESLNSEKVKIQSEINEFKSNNSDFLPIIENSLETLSLRNQSPQDRGDIRQLLLNVLKEFEEKIPERANAIQSKLKNISFANSLNRILKNQPAEIYNLSASILLTKDKNITKTARKNKMKIVLEFFDILDKEDLAKDIDKSIVNAKKSLDNKILRSIDKLNKTINVDLARDIEKANSTIEDKLHTEIANLNSEIRSAQKSMPFYGERLALIEEKISELGEDNLFELIDNYLHLEQQMQLIKNTDTNSFRREISLAQLHYKNNTISYVRNRIADRVEGLRSQQQTKAILTRIANNLKRSKKAFKTFDKMKNGEGSIQNFSAMSEAIPIWMMGLDDVNRIIPNQIGLFDYLIIDEASQCNLAYALPAMSRAKHTIFFGDTLQMRDTNTKFKSNDVLLSIAKKHKIPDAYQIKAESEATRSVMDIGKLSGFKEVSLRYHYRSPKQLIDFSNQHFYSKNGGLEVINDNITPFENTNRVMINHVITPDMEQETGSKINISEAEYIADLIKRIKTNPKTKNKSIGVLTFFNEQAELLRDKIPHKDVKVSIIEGIQGDERDIIIYSFVIKSPDEKMRYIGLTSEGGEINRSVAEGRVNVAFSRAREQVHCVTSIEPSLWPSGIWIKKYLEHVEEKGYIKNLNSKSEQHFDSKFEEEVFEALSDGLDEEIYKIQTQVESCGFKIDIVVTNLKNGKKVAIECDGPTHFEKGNGQVYVESDWERQRVLESVGWEFYRIPYFDWQKNKQEEAVSLRSSIKNILSNSPIRLYADEDIFNTASLKNLELKSKKSTTHNQREATKHTAKDALNTLIKESKNPQTIKTPSLIKPRNSSISGADDLIFVDTFNFKQYLKSNVGKEIKFKYYTESKNRVDSEFRIGVLAFYTETTFSIRRNKSNTLTRYRIDKVIDFQ